MKYLLLLLPLMIFASEPDWELINDNCFNRSQEYNQCNTYYDDCRKDRYIAGGCVWHSGKRHVVRKMDNGTIYSREEQYRKPYKKCYKNKRIRGSTHTRCSKKEDYCRRDLFDKCVGHYVWLYRQEQIADDRVIWIWEKEFW